MAWVRVLGMWARGAWWLGRLGVDARIVERRHLAPSRSKSKTQMKCVALDMQTNVRVNDAIVDCPAGNGRDIVMRIMHSTSLDACMIAFMLDWIANYPSLIFEIHQDS